MARCFAFFTLFHLSLTYFLTGLAFNHYGMFHVTWTTFKFKRNQLGTVSVYVMSSVSLSNQRAH